MKKLAMFCLLVFAVIAYGADKWIDQIEILMTEQEKAEYKKLKSDADKEKFVTDFWAKRDPSPGTPENEYKSNHEKNAAEVNTRMKDKRAFESDMGQTLLLLGPPSDQKQEKGATSGYGDEEEEESATGKQVWTYKNLPADVASGEVKIEFQVSGSVWRFADKKQAQALLEKARLRTMKAGQASAHGSQEIPPKQPDAAPTKPPVGDVPPVTSPDVKAALDATATGTAPADIPVVALVDSFMTSEGEAFSTFAINASGDAGTKVGIRVLDTTGKIVKETELPFVDATATPPEPSGYFQTKLPMIPGEYSVALAVSSAGKVGGVKKSLSVPQNDGKIAMSSIILSKKFNQLTDAKPEKTPYTFGKIKVDPNTERVFSKSDELIILYEAYNFKQEPAGQGDLETVIIFQKGNEKPRAIPPNPAKGLVTGKKMTIPTSFALSESFFTPGEWKMKVTLTDKATKQSATQEVTFTIK